MHVLIKNKINFLLTINLIFLVSIVVFFFNLNVIIQISTTNMYVSWDSFEDVEEFQTIPHTSGIQNYELGIGACLISLRFNVNWQSARSYFHQHEQWKCHLWLVGLLSIYEIWHLMSRGRLALILCLVHIN